MTRAEKIMVLKESLPFGYDAIAYVDGSFNEKENAVGGGTVMFYNKLKGEETDLVKLFSWSFGEKGAESRNVTGEIFSAQMAVQEAMNEGCRSILILHDYWGVAHWVTGTWKARKTLTHGYKLAMLKMMKNINVSFEKVEGHSGDIGNDLADELAKKGCGLGTTKNDGLAEEICVKM